MILYLDASALVKLYAVEPGSDAVADAFAIHDSCSTSLLAYVETRSALGRKQRDGAIPPGKYASLVEQFEADWPLYAAVNVSQDLVRRAGGMAEEYGLKAIDAIHLATAAWVRDTAGSNVRFLCADQRLTKAAQAEGLAAQFVGR